MFAALARLLPTDLPCSRPALALAGAALALQPSAAAAQQACVTEREVSALVVYSTPLALRAIGTRCAGQFAPAGFMASSSAQLAARYAAHGNAAWPDAFSALVTLVGKEAATGPSQQVELVQLLRQMPEEAVRPLVDEIVAQKVAGEVDVQDCGKIERMFEALAPLEPQEAGNLIGVLGSIVGLQDVPVCAMEPG